MTSLIEKLKKFIADAPSEICKPDYNGLQKAISAFTFVVDCIYRVLLEFSKLVILVLVIIVSCDVFGRLVLNRSIYWGQEVALLLMVWTAFIAMAIGVEKGLHISISMFFNLFPKKLQWIIAKINTLATIFFGYILLVYGFKLVALTLTSTLPATQWPAGTAYAMMPVGGLFIIYFALLDLFGLGKYRHSKIEGNAEDEGKTDQQILEEMRASKEGGEENV